MFMLLQFSLRWAWWRFVYKAELVAELSVNILFTNKVVSDIVKFSSDLLHLRNCAALMIWLTLSLHASHTKDIILYMQGRDAVMQNIGTWVSRALTNIHYCTLFSDEKLFTITSVCDKLSYN